MPDLKSLNSATFACGQLTPDEVAVLRERGFASLVNHRPDGEKPGQPDSESIRRAAEANGLRYVHLPVSGLPDAAAVQGTAEVLAALQPGEKVLMFCRSGMRSTAAWALARRSQGADADTLREAAAGAGYDLSRLPL